MCVLCVLCVSVTSVYDPYVSVSVSVSVSQCVSTSKLIFYVAFILFNFFSLTLQVREDSHDPNIRVYLVCTNQTPRRWTHGRFSTDEG